MTVPDKDHYPEQVSPNADYEVVINPNLLRFGFDGDKEGAQKFADELCELVQRWIPLGQWANGPFACVEVAPIGRSEP